MDPDGPKALAEPSETAPPPQPAEPSREDEVEDGPSGGLLAKLFGFWARAASNEDLAEAIENARNGAAGSIPRARREMIERVVAFDEKRVDDVMAPRADIVAVDVDTPLGDLVKAFAEGGHSRMPIYRGDLDNPLGMVHVKDIVTLIAKPQGDPPPGSSILKQIKREVLYVPPSMRVMDLLVRMQASRIHMALVIDEYGGTDGLVTIEDLVEEIVGDINDEYDDEEAPTIAPRPGGWDADARLELTELAEVIGVEFTVDEGEAVDTLGGLVFSIAGRVPQRGEVLSHPTGYDFEVIDADARKIRKIRIRKAAPPPEPASETEV